MLSMLRLLPVLLICAAAAPVAAWEQPGQNELAAVQGDALQEAIIEAGFPLPPTCAEAQAAAGVHYGPERVAIKRCLMYRTSLAKSARNRISPEINRSTATMAVRLGAPSLFSRYLELMADESLSRRQQYALNQAFNYLVQETYSIDSLSIRLFSESLKLPPAEHAAFMLQLPAAHLFDIATGAAPPRERWLSDIQTMTTVLRNCDTILKTVHDRATADAAALQLQAWLPVWNTTRELRAYAPRAGMQFTPAENFAVQFLKNTTDSLYEMRRSLNEKDWCGSSRLESIDQLLR